jgi:putative addiction module component (TIGR02574 family)
VCKLPRGIPLIILPRRGRFHNSRRGLCFGSAQQKVKGITLRHASCGLYNTSGESAGNFSGHRHAAWADQYKEVVTMRPEMESLRNLSAAEKLQLVEDLWDDLANSPEPLPLPRWHREEADRRAAELRGDPSKAIDREELWRRVGERHGQ